MGVRLLHSLRSFAKTVVQDCFTHCVRSQRRALDSSLTLRMTKVRAQDDPVPNLYASVCKQNLLRGRHNDRGIRFFALRAQDDRRAMCARVTKLLLRGHDT
jgi:hypothetical protein